MSLPSAFSFAARAVTASVGDGLTRCTRRETEWVTGLLRFRDVLIMNRRGYITGWLTRGTTMTQFQLQADYSPAGDQPQAIARLVEGLQSGLAHQTLLGVTGSGKTFIDRRT